MSRTNANSNINNVNYQLSPEQQIQYQVQQRQLEIYRQTSYRSIKQVVTNDLESKLNILYSKLLVNYHWVFLAFGVLITFVLTGVSFSKQPLPNFLDPKRGFGARGEGTLTSQLIVMKNVNAEMTKSHKEVLELYAKIKRENKSDSWQHFIDDSDNNSQNDHAQFDTKSDVDNSTNKHDYIDYSDDDENDADYTDNYGQDDFDEYETKSVTSKKRRLRRSAPKSNDQNMLPNKKLLENFIYKKITGQQILEMLPRDLTINSDSKLYQNHAFNKVKFCNYSLGLDMNLEFYFSSSDDDSNQDSLRGEAQDQDEEDHGSAGAQAALVEAENMDSDILMHLNLTDDYFNDANSDVNFDVNSKKKLFKNMEKNLLNVRKLKSLCAWDRKILTMLTQPHKTDELCYFSLPQVVALLNNKTDCMDINANDVKKFLKIVLKCYDLHSSGILYAAAEELKTKPEIIKLINKNNPITKFIKLPIIKDNICFKNNLLHIFFEYLADKDFLSNKPEPPQTAATITSNSSHFGGGVFQQKSFEIKVSSLLVINSHKISVKTHQSIGLFNEDFLYEFYLKYFHKDRYDDKETKVTSINLKGLRENAAMRFISQEMSLVAVAIILIVIVTLLYLKSIFISLIVNLGVGMSVGVAFFAYRIVFDIDLFPFINMMAAFLLIGIACDNVYVLFDSWYTEKGRVIMEDLPDMIEKQYTVLKEDKSTTTAAVDSTIKQADDYYLPPIFIQRRFNSLQQQQNGKQADVDKRPTIYRQSNENLEENETFLNAESQVKTKSLKPMSAGQAVLGNTSLNTELLEKGVDISNYELNPAYVRLAPLNDAQMIRAMGGTLRHAASSIFVTSFTTAAAFLTNYITKLPYIQLFGVFTGMTILIYFSMVITMVAAFVITYEKAINPFPTRCKLRTKLTDKLEKAFDKLMDFISLMNYRIIRQWMPKMLIKFRLISFCVFLLLGVAGMLTVFVWPKLKPPNTWRYQFFKDGNLFENFEFNTKDRFLSYINEEKRNLTNPEIFFVFGILNIDTGRVFNPDDDGHLLYDKKFDFFAPASQLWLNDFINVSLASRPDLFQADEIVQEWRDYLFQIQLLCHSIFEIDDKQTERIHLPYSRDKLVKCNQAIAATLSDSTVDNFESMMASFPRRIIFMANGSDVTGLLLRVNSNRIFSDYSIVRDYYEALKQFHAESYANAPEGYKSGWFISVAFALYDLQYQLITGTYSSLVASMCIALVILLLTSGNIVISAFAIVTISFTIADTIAIFVYLGWTLSFLESIIIIMSVGLSVDFVCHYGVAYMNSEGNHFDVTNATANTTTDEIDLNSIVSDPATVKKQTSNNTKKTIIRGVIDRYKLNNKDRFARIYDIFDRVGSAVTMAAFTTFLAGLSMYPSSLTSFSKMGQFLMLVMLLSYLFATFFFVPMCALFGPTKDFGNMNIGVYIARAYSAMCGKCTKTCTKKLSEHPKTTTTTTTNKSNEKSNTQNDPLMDHHQLQQLKTLNTSNA